MKSALRNAWWVVLGIIIAGCASTPHTEELAKLKADKEHQTRIDELNMQLALQSSASSSEPSAEESYRLGPGDVIEVVVFDVPELSREAQVDGYGRITLPLIGEVPVGGKTVAEAERQIASLYEASYVRNPQVSVLVKEHRSHRVTVMGAVKEPKVYAVQRSVRLVDALAMAGGLAENAGHTIHVMDFVIDDKGKRVRRSLVIDLNDLLNGKGNLNIVLGENAVIHVPEAGVVYVEGAVKKPGAYPLHRDTTVLKAVTMAGGLEFEAEKSSIKVLRSDAGGPVAVVDIDHVREHPKDDFTLEDGDVVVVETNAAKSAFSGFFRGIKGIFGFGYSLNR
ncbi:MAG: iron dicitrate ABC transporter ATP-binding protein [Gammaproteobacteria bacterium]|nr:MAG: iron dicitrate ABC transporter ATP-binding protein [Gammaproteobacteria bacterium]